jgi:hypothetical protein
VAGLPPHQAGVAVDSRRHSTDGPRYHRHRCPGRPSVRRVDPPCRRVALASKA